MHSLEQIESGEMNIICYYVIYNNIRNAGMLLEQSKLSTVKWITLFQNDWSLQTKTHKFAQWSTELIQTLVFVCVFPSSSDPKWIMQVYVWQKNMRPSTRLFITIDRTTKSKQNRSTDATNIVNQCCLRVQFFLLLLLYYHRSFGYVCFTKRTHSYFIFRLHFLSSIHARKCENKHARGKKTNKRVSSRTMGCLFLDWNRRIRLNDKKWREKVWSEI